MKKNTQKLLILLTFCILQSAFCHAQNLVPNPSFENYSICPNNYYMLPTDWYTCSGDPDYYNACDLTNDFGVPRNGFGFQQAFDGDAYCGFYSMSFPNSPPPYPYKEYLGCKLLSAAQIGEKYYISFYASLADAAGIEMATNNIGLLFSTKSFQDYQPYDSIWGIPTLNYSSINDTNLISDTLYWTKISGSFIADSAYQYMIIGDFFDILHTDTVFFNNPYWFQQHAYYYLDKVCISSDSTTCNQADVITEYKLIENINIYPNPTNTLLHISAENINNYYLKIYNITGQLIMQAGKLNSDISIDISQNLKGVYLIKIITANKILNKKLIIN